MTSWSSVAALVGAGLVVLAVGVAVQRLALANRWRSWSDARRAIEENIGSIVRSGDHW